eukprot:47228-Amphidinium_carterae.1
MFIQEPKIDVRNPFSVGLLEALASTCYIMSKQTPGYCCQTFFNSPLLHLLAVLNMANATRSTHSRC